MYALYVEWGLQYSQATRQSFYNLSKDKSVHVPISSDLTHVRKEAKRLRDSGYYTKIQIVRLENIK